MKLPAGTDGNRVANVIFNWLLQTTKTIIAKVNQHGQLLEFTQREVDKKVSTEKVQELRAWCRS